MNIKVIIFKKGPEFHFYPGSNIFLKLDDDEVITLSNLIDAQSSNQAATISCILSYGNIDKIEHSKLSNINMMAGNQSFDFDVLPPSRHRKKFQKKNDGFSNLCSLDFKAEFIKTKIGLISALREICKKLFQLLFSFAMEEQFYKFTLLIVCAKIFC